MFFFFYSQLMMWPWKSNVWKNSFFYQVHQQIMRIFFFFLEYQMDIESTDPMETSKVKPKMRLNRKKAVNFVFWVKSLSLVKTKVE